MLLQTNAMKTLSLAPALAWCAALGAQHAATPSTPTPLPDLLARLDGDATDWVALLGVADKAAAIGAAAIPVVKKAIADVSDRDDARFALRLLGVLARLDRAGVQQLRERIVAGDAAAIAARVLGRCGADHDATSAVLIDCLRDEKREAVAAAIAMADADAGATKVASLIGERLQAGIGARNAQWFEFAFAQLNAGATVGTIVEWLASEPFAGVGLLAARLHRDERLEVALLERLDGETNATHREWLLQSLGACGGDRAKKALRDALAAAGSAFRSTALDPRLFALLRLGEADAVATLMHGVTTNGSSASGGIEMQFMGPDLAHAPELFGKWRLADAPARLQTILKTDDVAMWTRSHAARGLCWLRDTRGLTAAADLLATASPPAQEFGVPEAMIVAQRRCISSSPTSIAPTTCRSTRVPTTTAPSRSASGGRHGSGRMR